MPQHHLIGELSLRLAQLHDVAGQPTFEHAFAQLRREAERSQYWSLSSPLRQALTLGDELCWDSLARGDAAAFSSQARICADLYDFGVSARVLPDAN